MHLLNFESNLVISQRAIGVGLVVSLLHELQGFLIASILEMNLGHVEEEFIGLLISVTSTIGGQQVLYFFNR